MITGGNLEVPFSVYSTDTSNQIEIIFSGTRSTTADGFIEIGLISYPKVIDGITCSD